MKYVTLAPQYALRGWSDLKYGIADLYTEDLYVRHLSEYQYQAIELVTSGGISIDDRFIPERMRKMAYKALEKGILIECGSEKKIEEYQKYRYSEARCIYAMLWSITGNCNLRCKHCYISSGENCYGELPFEKCLQVIDQMAEANVNAVALTGGEPLVRKDFWKIIDALLERHIQVYELFTNGMMVTDELVDGFEKRNIHLTYFLLSYDGVGCHDWLRGVKGAEKKAIEAIKLLKRRGYELVVATSLHEGNIHSLLPTYEMMKKLGVDFWKAAPIIDTGNWRYQENREINISKVYDEYLKLLKRYSDDNAPLQLGLGGFYQCKKNRLSDGSSPFQSGKACNMECETLCESTVYYPYLLPDGRILPCISMSGSKMEDIAPSIFDKDWSMAKILGSSPIEKYSRCTYGDMFERNPECASCEHRFICRGCRANALSCGGFFEKDPLACTFIKGGYAEKIKEITGE